MASISGSTLSASAGISYAPAALPFFSCLMAFLISALAGLPNQ